MIVHIVRTNEVVSDILNNYHITIDDLRNANRHLTDMVDIKPGTKLMIPILNSETEQILEESMPLVENLNPSLKDYNLDDDFEMTNTKEEQVYTQRRGIRYVNPRVNRTPIYNPFLYKRKR